MHAIILIYQYTDKKMRPYLMDTLISAHMRRHANSRFMCVYFVWSVGVHRCVFAGVCCADTDVDIGTATVTDNHT